MLRMLRNPAILALFLCSSLLSASVKDVPQPSYPSFDHDTAQAHELKPHREDIPVEGVGQGFSQLSLTVIVSPGGDVVSAKPQGSDADMKFWPQVEGEVLQWKFVPFEQSGKPVTARIQEYINLVPPEQMPKVHVPPPPVQRDSNVSITLERTACMGSCPGYSVTVNTSGILFDGKFAVVALGRHRDSADADAVRSLARQFTAADFYSMEPVYRWMATDLPTYMLSISIDGHKMSVEDYAGEEVGMPQVISELEERVDEFARTKRWVTGSEGLVEALEAEHYNFQTFDAQVMLKAAAQKGQTQTVQELLDAGVSLKRIPAPKPKELYMTVPFEHVGWLNAASRHPKTLQLLISHSASKDSQEDKDLALADAADSGEIDSVRTLLAYGANPNFDHLTIPGAGSGSALTKAASSGNPAVVREILKYHPNLELKDYEGQTAIFAAGDYRDTDADGARVECVRLLAEAGANINARDENGNTPLHETFLDDVVEELIKLGANVNARNDDGETPLLATVSDDVAVILLKHGADPYIRNKKGQNALDAAAEHGPSRAVVLRKAMAELTDAKAGLQP